MKMVLFLASWGMRVQDKKKHLQKIIFFSLSFLFILSHVGSVSAAPNTPPGPDRFTFIPQEYERYIWWMMTWEENELVCEVVVEHEGLPLYSEVYIDCGEGLANAWLAQESCDFRTYSNSPAECSGYYLYLAERETAVRDAPFPLAPPMVWITLPDCVAEDGTNRCERPPTLVLHGEEPLGGEEIISITGAVDGESFTCLDAICQLPINETDEGGSELSFWAVSSYGDTSRNFNARVRVLAAENEQGEPFWYVDVLSEQWRGEANASCAESWDAFPPEGGVPFWLSTPADATQLESDLEYAYLAGTLIETGLVDASQCIDFGLDEYRQATQCGLEAAAPAMIDWQNRFDQLIMDAALETEIPAVLLKRLFARESQFWPGVFNEGTEFQRDGSQFDKLFEEGDEFQIGGMSGHVLHTPGHTPACLTYVVGDAAFVGDTLFMPDFGTARCDFPGGSSETLFASIQKILALPDDTRIFVGHDYKAPGRDEFAWETTVAEQKALNIHIGAGKTQDDFVKMRNERDATLAKPKLIIPSLQVNMRAGNLPEADADGNVYLKVPVNKL